MSGTCKLVLLLLIGVIDPARPSSGQPAPEQAEPAESVSAEMGQHCPNANESCDDAAHQGWISSRPFCSLFTRLKADCGPIPWANWTEHPLSVGCFAGVIHGGPLIADWVGTSTGFDGGWRLGWDVSPNLGTETRLAYASPRLYDSYRADRALDLLDKSAGLPADDPQRSRYDHREAQVFQWDVDILYYPWGETRLRPYFLTGMGLTNSYFADRLAQYTQTTCLSLPLGLGVKYLCNERLAVRLDCLDDISMSSNHLLTQHNLSLTAGVELRFGGSRKVYWPWDLGREFW